MESKAERVGRVARELHLETGDPWQLARRVGVKVRVVDRQTLDLEDPEHAGMGRRGCYLPKTHEVLVHSGLSFLEQKFAVGHELMHAIDPAASEELCDLFAAEFAPLPSWRRSHA